MAIRGGFFLLFNSDFHLETCLWGTTLPPAKIIWAFMSPCPVGTVQCIWIPGAGHVLESHLAVLTGFKAQELCMTASVTRNSRVGCLVWVAMKPGGTAHTFCTTYFKLDLDQSLLLCWEHFASAWMPATGEFILRVIEPNGLNRRHMEITALSAHLDSQDSKTTGQISTISALLMHLSQ